MVNFLEMLYAAVGGMALIAFVLLVQGWGPGPEAERRRRRARWAGLAAVIGALGAMAIYRLASSR